MPVVRCAHMIRPVLPTPKPGIVGHPDNLDPFTRMELEHRADPCPLLATHQAEDGSPRCQTAGHGAVALLDPERMLAQLLAVTAAGVMAEAEGRVALKIVQGQMVSVADCAPCSEGFRANLMARPMGDLRAQAYKVVDGIADEILETEAVHGLCNHLSTVGDLCQLPAAHPSENGEHVTFHLPRVAFRGWSLPDTTETGWVWESKRDGLWFKMGPGWMTRVLPRPLSFRTFERDLGVTISNPETYGRDVLAVLREILPAAEARDLHALVKEIVEQTNRHPTAVIATIFALIHRKQLVGGLDTLAWPEEGAAEAVVGAPSAPSSPLSKAQVALLRRAGKPGPARARGIRLRGKAATDARTLEEQGLGTVAPQGHPTFDHFTINDAGLARLALLFPAS